jgi:hypothetical protein
MRALASSFCLAGIVALSILFMAIMASHACVYFFMILSVFRKYNNPFRQLQAFACQVD